MILTYKPLNKKIISDFLVDKFIEINVFTQPYDWQYIKDYYINDFTLERKFFHKNLGFVELREINHELYFNIDILDVFRCAARNGDLDLVKTLFSTLIQKYKNPNVQSYYEDTEYNLTGAIRGGNLDVINFLVENGVHIHVENEINIIAALKASRYDIAQYLLEHDEKVNLEVVLNHPAVIGDMSRFIKNWKIFKELNAEVSIKDKAETKLKI